MTQKTEEYVEQELKRQLEILEYSTVEVTPREDFIEMLRRSIRSDIPLRIKCGIDPTRVDIHVGHLVPYRKMRAFQDLGHIGVVIIGDYTARIGDPTGKVESRPPLTEEQVLHNAKFYMEQLLTVLDEAKTEFRFQSEWFSQISLADILKWAGQVTVAKLMGHETFGQRVASGQTLGLHELFYPVLQGIDSVYVEADVELGGTDQKFNILMGRDFQKNKEQKPQVAMLLPIILGLDGKQKMSKSLDNYIGIWDEAFDKFGKIMSIPDDLMLHYSQYVGQSNASELKNLQNALENGLLHPNEAKKQLATRVVSLFHGADVAQKMREQFEAVFAKKQVPDDIEEYKFVRGDNIVQILVSSGTMPSNSEARRMLKQNAVHVVHGDNLVDGNFTPDESFVGQIIKVGKRKFIKLI